MRILLLLFSSFLIYGCAGNPYYNFYKPWEDENILHNSKEIEFLKPDEEPKVFSTNNFKRDILLLRSKMLIPIGASSFNGGYQDESSVKEQARNIGATVVLVSTKYTNTQTNTTPLILPDSSTTYHSGTIYGSGFSGGYNGTSTTYGSTVVPVTTNQRRFDQEAVFFVRMNKKIKFGVAVQNLTPDLRTALQRNTGAFIEIVFEDSPAFYANVIPGDILIKVNQVDVKNAQHATKLMNKTDPSASSAVLTIIRSGEQKDIVINFDNNS